ncbi:hypothetical protein N568_0105340 [Lactococcus garvieae TRF1]|jgi:hypothetical protein|uniref:Uncharacterized protein n=1 Tax=Lactococcus garvieae TRF1 TaxID=1380772 RepID=V8AQ06_9LACT|nr:hypothetical protein N568_0105340 [Lactococcus garvieae TRF1]
MVLNKKVLFEGFLYTFLSAKIAIHFLKELKDKMLK